MKGTGIREGRWRDDGEGIWEGMVPESVGREERRWCVLETAVVLRLNIKRKRRWVL